MAELYALVDPGVLDEDSPFELIDGELLAMSPKHNRHEVWKRNMVRLLILRRSRCRSTCADPTCC